MDAAYDAQGIREHCESLGQAPLFDSVQRAVPIPHRAQQDSLRGHDKRSRLPKTTASKLPPFTPAQQERYEIRTLSERVWQRSWHALARYARLKDEFGTNDACPRRLESHGAPDVRHPPAHRGSTAQTERLITRPLPGSRCGAEAPKAAACLVARSSRQNSLNITPNRFTQNKFSL